MIYKKEECLEKIFNSFKEGKTLVFSTEVVARSYLREYLLKEEGNVVFQDQAISFDTFLSLLIDKKEIEGKRKVNKTERMIFSHNLLKENNNLTYFIPKPSSSKVPFEKFISSSLPSLKKYVVEDEEKNKDEEEYQDAALIYNEYVSFLSDNNLYEDMYLEKHLGLININDYIFVFPEVFQNDYVNKMSSPFSLGEWSKHTIELEKGKPNTHLNEYKNSISEIRDVMRKIEKDLLTTPPEDIAITTPALDEYRDYLLTEAKKWSIPLSFSSSEKLSSYKEGRFFLKLKELVKNDFKVDDMKSFFLDPAFCFKDRDKYIPMVLKGIDYKLIYGGLSNWKKILCESDDETKFYALLNLCKNIYTEKDATKLFSLVKTLETYIENDFVSGNRVLGKCLEIIEKMKDYTLLEEERPFELFTSILEESEYTSQEEKNTVKVYKYPVTSTLLIKKHYVIGLSEKGTGKFLSPSPFRKSDRDEGDIQEELLFHYSMPLYGDLELSGTSDMFSGSSLLPSFFLQNRINVNGDPLDDYIKDENKWKSDMAKENRRKLHSSGNKEEDIVSLDKSKPHEISVTTFVDYDKCLFRGFSKDFLHLKEKNYDFKEDFATIGDILHNTIEKSLEKGKAFSSVAKEIIIKNFEDILDCAEKDGSIKDINNKEKKLNITHLERLKIEKDFSENVTKVVSVSNSAKNKSEVEKFINASCVDIECRIEPMKIENSNIILGRSCSENDKNTEKDYRNRIDTLLLDGDDYYILDYKKNAKSYIEEGDFSHSSIQLYLYKILYENMVRKENVVKYLSFFSFEDGKYMVLSSLGGLEGENKKTGETKTIIEKTEEIEKEGKIRVNGVVSNIMDGKFNPMEYYNEKPFCAFCPYVRMCRRRYNNE